MRCEGHVHTSLTSFTRKAVSRRITPAARRALLLAAISGVCIPAFRANADTISIGYDSNGNPLVVTDSPFPTNAANQYILEGGILRNNVLDLSAGNLSFAYGTLDGVTIQNGDLNAQPGYISALTVLNDLFGDGHALNLNTAAYQGVSLVFDGGDQTISALTISGHNSKGYNDFANIFVGGPASSGPTTLTIAPTATLRGDLIIRNTFTIPWVLDPQSASSQLVNWGTISADISNPFDEFGIYVNKFQNYSLVQATNGGELGIYSSTWRNWGRIRVGDNSTLNLGGTFTPGNLGDLYAAPTGNVNIRGTMDLTGTTFSPADFGGKWQVIGGTIKGGDLQLRDSSLYVLDGNFDGATVTLGGTTTGSILQFDNSTGHVIDNVTIVGTPATDTGAVSTIYFPVQWWFYPGTLTLGSNATIRGALTVAAPYMGNTFDNYGTIQADLPGQTLSLNTDIFVNHGSVRAINGSTLAINSNFGNLGTISVAGGSTLNLNGFTSSNLGSLSVSPDSYVNMVGAVDNTGFDLKLADYGGNWALDGGSITGGTVEVGDRNFIVRNTYWNSAFNGVTFNLTGTSAPSRLVFDDSYSNRYDNVEVVGGGSGPVSEILLGSDTASGFHEITLSPNALVHGVLAIRSGNPGVTSSLINQGTIDADQPGGTIRILTDYFTNQGALKAENGGVLDLASPNWDTSAGTITLNSGTLNLHGGDLGKLGTVTATPDSDVNLLGYLTGYYGPAWANGGRWHLPVGSMMDSATLSLTNADFHIEGGVVFASTLVLNGGGYGSRVIFDNTDTVGQAVDISGEGKDGGQRIVQIGGSGAAGNIAFDININMTLRGELDVVQAPGVSVALSNGGGSIRADQPGRMLNINVDSFDNNASVSAVNGGILQINAAQWTNNTAGVVSADMSTLNLGGSQWVNNGQILLNQSSGNFYGQWSNHGANQGTIKVTDSTLNLGGAFTTADIGQLTANGGSSINITGQMDNTGTTLRPADYGGSWALWTGTISGGMIDLSGTSFSSMGGGTLSGVTFIKGDINVNESSLTVTRSIDGDGSSINLGGSDKGSVLTFDGPAQILGNITVTGNPATPNGNVSTVQLASSFVSLSPYATIRGALNINDGPSTSAFLVNNGVIDADQAGQTLTINVSQLANNNRLNARNGGTLVINSPTFSNGDTGEIRAVDSTININTPWTSTGSIGLKTNSRLITTGDMTNFGSIIQHDNSLMTVTGLFTHVGGMELHEASRMGVLGDVNHFGTTRLFGTSRMYVSGSLWNTGWLNLHDADTVVHVGGLFTNTGTISGNGTIEGSVDSYRVISPGNSPGTLHITGDLTNNDGATIVMEIGPTGSDQLIVDGLATLGGTLDVRFIDGYAPTSGSWTLFSAGQGITFNFDQTTVEGLPAGTEFQYDPASGVASITAVPEPVALLSLLCAASLLTVRRQRRAA